MLKGFKDFIMRGNIIDLAVAVAIGAAFTALIAAVTDAVISPAIGLILGGGVNAGAIEVNGQVFDITLLINAIITFLVTAFVVYFAFVVPMNKVKERYAKEAEEEIDPLQAQVDLLRDIKAALENPKV